MNRNIINEDLYEKSKAFVISAMNLLISYLQKGEKIPSIMVEKNRIEKDGSCRIEYVQKPIFSILTYNHMKEIESLPEYQRCVEVMRKDATISKHLDCLVGTSNSRIHRTAWDYLDYLLMRQLSGDLNRFEFDLQNFNSAYNDLERFFYTDALSLKAFSPLHNFQSDVDQIDLGDNLHIRRITSYERENLINELKWSPTMPHFEALGLHYAIEFAYETQKEFGDITRASVTLTDQEISDKIGKLVTALRLYKPGIVGLNMIKTISTSELPIPVGMSRFSMPYKSFLGERYALTGNEVNEFRRFWNMVRQLSLEKFTQVDIALRRFNYAYERDKLEDKLIDFMVAFEALFFKEGESGEFRHKLSIRVSRFLKDEYIQRKWTAEKVNRFYDERSKVVHGEKVKLKDDFVRTVEDLLRKSIRLFLERLQTSTHDEILLHLDLD